MKIPSGFLSRLTRRDALKLLGAGAAGTLAAGTLTPQGWASSATEAVRTDVIVVGAGFAGLCAARNLVRQGKKVVVLEARNRVGGRVKRGTLAGHAVDVGGMWVGPTQTRLLELLKEYDLHLVPQFEDGKNVTEVNGKHVLANREDPGLDPESLAEFDRVSRELDRLSSQLPLEAPWTAPNAEALDAMTVQDWLDANTHDPAARAFLQASIRADFAADAYQLSLLYLLFYLRSGDNFETLNSYKNSAQAYTVRETMHELAARMAADLGSKIILEAPVRSISQSSNDVTVISDKGAWRADYGIVAIPLPLTARVAFDPPLSSERDILAQRMPMGSVIKYWVAYEKPFWRSRGLNGMTWTDLPPSAAICDVSPSPDGPGFLVGFIEAHSALKWTGRPQEERRKLIVASSVSSDPKPRIPSTTKTRTGRPKYGRAAVMAPTWLRAS
jgi:monoamine oxidase